MNDQDRRNLAIQEKRQKLAEIRLEQQRRAEARNTAVDARIGTSGDSNRRQNGENPPFLTVYFFCLGTLATSSSARDMEALLAPLGLPTQTLPTPSMPLQRNGSNHLLLSNGSLNNFVVSDGSVRLFE